MLPVWFDEISYKTATMSKQHSTLSKGRNFTINSFDIVAVFGNKVERWFEKVERCFDIVAGVDGALECYSVVIPDSTIVAKPFICGYS